VLLDKIEVEFCFSGTYDENEIELLVLDSKTQKALWDNAQFQYENPDIGLKEMMKAIEVFTDDRRRAGFAAGN
jgi:hypothetical protein